SLLSDLARRDDAIADADDAALRFAHCTDGRSRLAAQLADRGKEDAAVALARELYAESPADPGVTSRLADRLLAQGKPAEAAALFGSLETLWPRTASLALRRAELLGKAGDAAGADRERERAMSLDGGDVGLRRALAYRKGTDVLSDQHRDAIKLIHDFEASGRTFDTKAVLILD